MRASAAHSTDTRIPHQPALRPKKSHEPTYTGSGELKMEMVDISDFSGLGVTEGRLIGSISAANFMMIPVARPCPSNKDSELRS